MREDTTSRTEAEAARAADLIGRGEWIGGGVGDQEPDPVWAKALGPDPWGDLGPVHRPTRLDLPIPDEPPF